jgi:glycosyltransferase involved in cell wall biosynthesis
MSTLVSNHLKDCMVSVVMCTYNGEHFLEEQLESILNQTWLNLEILIADDASTDNTWSMLQAYTNRDGRIQIFQNEQRLGYTENFSRNCARATAPYLVIADQDDVWHLQKIERLMSALPEHVPMIYCDSIRFSGTPPRDAKPNPTYRRFDGTEILKLALFNTISGHAMLARTSFIHSLLPFQEGLMYDWYAGAVAAANGGVAYFPETLVYQRVHDRNATVGDTPSYLKRKEKPLYNNFILKHLNAFCKIQGLSLLEQQELNRLTYIWEKASGNKFSLTLFCFLINRRTLILWHKRKSLRIFSHIKHLYLITRN